MGGGTAGREWGERKERDDGRVRVAGATGGRGEHVGGRAATWGREVGGSGRGARRAAGAPSGGDAGTSTDGREDAQREAGARGQTYRARGEARAGEARTRRRPGARATRRDENRRERNTHGRERTDASEAGADVEPQLDGGTQQTVGRRKATQPERRTRNTPPSARRHEPGERRTTGRGVVRQTTQLGRTKSRRKVRGE